MRLSVVVITRNEAFHLPRLLASVKDWADEVIVFDSGSTDNTVALAEEAGCTVVDCAWEGWSRTKNRANEQARGEWILSLDADEAPDSECREAILEHMAQGTHTEAGILRVGEVNRLTNYCGQWVRHSGWYPDRKVRLWPNGSAVWEGAIHERAVFGEPVEVRPIAGHVAHYSYPYRADHLAQIERFGRVWAEDKLREGSTTPLSLVMLKVAAQWVKTYLIRGGFRDGVTGWTIARLSAWATWRKHARLRSLRRGAPTPPHRVLVCRTDALGDLVLTLPLVAALKREFPDAQVDLLVRPYAASLGRLAVGVSEVLSWTDAHAAAPGSAGAALLKSGHYDAAVLAFPDAAVVKACQQAGIARRLGSGRRWHTLFRLTHRNWDGRRTSGGHESWHGLRLLMPLGIEPVGDFRHANLLRAPRPDATVESLLSSCGRKPILLHPGSHGSAGNWPAGQYAALALALAKNGEAVGFTGTEEEGRAFQSHLPDHPLIVSFFGACTLEQLVALQAGAGAVVASSTGPLHTAAALGIPVVGLYRDAAPQWARRWGPNGSSVHVVETRTLTESGNLDIGLDQVITALDTVMASRPNE